MFLKVAKIHNVVPLMTPYSLVGMYKRSVPSSGQLNTLMMETKH